MEMNQKHQIDEITHFRDYIHTACGLDLDWNTCGQLWACLFAAAFRRGNYISFRSRLSNSDGESAT
jgi:hypothetical protein